MIKKVTLISLFLIITSFGALAARIGGAQVTYRYLGNEKFEITYKYYRDCRGTPSQVNSYVLNCPSTNQTKYLSGTLVKIEDITNTCSQVGIKCYPQNQTISGSDPATEEHTFMDTIDLNGLESAFKNCCVLRFGFGQCCRNGAITTGAAGNDFFVYSTLDLCKAPTNSSPVFIYQHSMITLVDQPLYKSYMAIDPDNDSLSYRFVDPKTSWSGKTTWGGLSSSHPFDAYYPKGYNKSNGPNPNTTPPIGIYLDAASGNLIATPVDGAQVTVMAISVQEWRKDSKGLYQQIGEIILDQQLIIINGSNNFPNTKVKLNYNLCAGKPFVLDIPTEDKDKSDTVVLGFKNSIIKSKITIDNSNVKLPVAKFQWTPDSSDIGKSNNYFNVEATDNGCSRRGVSIKTISLKVFQSIDVKSVIKKLDSSTFELGLKITKNPYSHYSVKYISTSVKDNLRHYYFKSSKLSNSILDLDTLVIKKNGTYIITQSFYSESECNNISFNDTLVINNLLEVSLGGEINGIYKDTSFCKNKLSRIKAQLLNGVPPFTYNWRIGSYAKSDTLGYFDYTYFKSDTLFLSVKDANGQTNSTYRVIKTLDIPEIEAGKDQSICTENTARLKAKNSKTETLTWTWMHNNQIMSNSDSLVAVNPGKYVLQAINSNQCVSKDSLELTHFKTVPLQLISGTYCQSKNFIGHNEIILPNANKNFKTISWQLNRSLKKPSGNNNTLGELFEDRNPNAGYDFKIYFDITKIELGSKKDSLKFVALATDSNGCKSSDTMTLTLIQQPQIAISKVLLSRCLNTEFNLDSFSSCNSNHRWLPLNRPTFQTWPSNSALNQGKIPANYLKTPGNYRAMIEANNEYCFAYDSMSFNMLALPIPILGYYKTPGHIKFMDESKNTINRRWYINNKFYTSMDTFTVTRDEINNKTVRLSVTGSNGCSNDTSYLMSTSIHKLNANEFELFPNPADDFLYISISNLEPQAFIEIYDGNGKRLISKPVNNRQEKIDISYFRTGLYYLKYTSENSQGSFVFIKK